MGNFTTSKVLGLIVLPLIAASANANLIRNASFEGTVPASQGYLPTDWVITNSSPDTYNSNTSTSSGLPPSAYGNFTGITAYDGDQWVAGWSLIPETFGQWLSDDLTVGTVYDLSGYLHQAVRSDLNNPGGYDVYLNDGSSSGSILLGSLGATTSVSDGWQFFSFSFTATDAMSSLSFIEFDPFGTFDAAGRYAYAGLDMVSLTGREVSPVPLPAAAWLFGSAIIGAGIVGRRKKKAA